MSTIGESSVEQLLSTSEEQVWRCRISTSTHTAIANCIARPLNCKEPFQIQSPILSSLLRHRSTAKRRVGSISTTHHQRSVARVFQRCRCDERVGGNIFPLPGNVSYNTKEGSTSMGRSRAHSRIWADWTVDVPVCHSYG